MSNLIDRPALKRLAAEASMSDDPDFQKANCALQVLRQARLSRNETAARMVEHLAYVTTNTGLRTPEIEETQQAAWVAISELANALKEEGFAGPTLWKAALSARIVDLRSRCPRSSTRTLSARGLPQRSSVTISKLTRCSAAFMEYSLAGFLRRPLLGARAPPSCAKSDHLEQAQ
jgi:hypothetical protein